MESLQTIIRRLRNSKGYGVHSPNDYSFIKNVVNERLPYYQYGILAKEGQSKKERKLNELLLRIANFCQPEEIVVLDNKKEEKTKYLQAGCRKATINDHIGNKKTLIYTTINQQTEKIIKQTSDNSVIIINGINKTNEAKAIWKQITARLNKHTLFDIKHIAIIIINHQQHQKLYKLYF